MLILLLLDDRKIGGSMQYIYVDTYIEYMYTYAVYIFIYLLWWTTMYIYIYLKFCCDNEVLRYSRFAKENGFLRKKKWRKFSVTTFRFTIYRLKIKPLMIWKKNSCTYFHLLLLWFFIRIYIFITNTFRHKLSG